MNTKAKYLTPSHISRRVAVHKNESRVVGRLTGIKAEAGDPWRITNHHVVIGATTLILIVGGIELDVDPESEVEVLSA